MKRPNHYLLYQPTFETLEEKQEHQHMLDNLKSVTGEDKKELVKLAVEMMYLNKCKKVTFYG